MRPRRKYTDAQRAEALDLYETHGPTAVHRQLGIPKSTVRKWARLTGRHTTAAARTRDATQAVTLSAAQARAEASAATIHAANAVAAVIRRRLETEAQQLPLRELATVYGILVDKHVLLARLDHASDDCSAVDAWIHHVIDGTPPR